MTQPRTYVRVAVDALADETDIGSPILLRLYALLVLTKG